jgi:hypothetical protein
MGGACGTYGTEERRIQGFGGEIRGKETTWKVDLDGRLVRGCTMDLKEIDAEDVGWIDLACDRDKWRALANAAMDLCVSWNARNFLTSCRGTCSSRIALIHVVI